MANLFRRIHVERSFTTSGTSLQEGWIRIVTCDREDHVRSAQDLPTRQGILSAIRYALSVIEDATGLRPDQLQVQTSWRGAILISDKPTHQLLLEQFMEITQ